MILPENSFNEGINSVAFAGLFTIISYTLELSSVGLIEIDFHVIIAYGVAIVTVCDNLIETVKYKVEQFTGMKVNKINIHVEGVRVID